MSDSTSLLFFGTPEFAVPSVEALAEAAGYRICAVVTETDKPAGRGQKLHAPPVKLSATRRGLAVLQPRSLRGVAPQSKLQPAEDDLDAYALRQVLAQQQPKIGITVAYGKIVPKSLLAAFPCGIINVHASLLPRWRGAAPLQRALLAGDAETGVCIMQTEPSLDTGPVFYQQRMAIAADETYGTLHDRLARLGADALRQALPGILDGTLTAEPQSEEGITYADKWTPADYRIDWDESAEQIDRRVRACAPVPGARTQLEDTALKIFATEPAPAYSYPPSPAGTIVDVQRKKIVIACGNAEFICPTEVQLAGRKRMPIAAAMQGFTFTKGSTFQAGR